MGRRMVIVDQGKLQIALNLAEKNGALKNLSELWKAAEVEYNKLDGIPEPVTFSTVMLRAIEWKLLYTTKAGKKGKAKGVALSAEQKAAMQAGRGKRKSGSHPMKDKVRAAMEQRLKDNDQLALLPLVDRVIEGSPSACRKWNCLECVCYDRKEVRDCSDFACAFYLKRPYQKFKEGDVEDVLEGTDATEAAA